LDNQQPRSRWGRIGLSLENVNVRRFVVGSNLSSFGNWMQQTAELWLVLQLTGSGTALGIHTALRFGPLLLFGPYGGLITDRSDRLRLLLITQALHALASVMLVAVALLPDPTVLLVYANAGARGFINLVDNPLRRRFLRDLATDEELPNAVALESAGGTISRAVGPALAGAITAAFGVLWCFVVNTLSFAFVLVALLMIDRSKLRPAVIATRGPGQIRAGFAYASREPRILAPLVISFVVGVFAWNYVVIAPVYASVTLSGDASLYGLLLSAAGLGSFIGAVAMSRAAVHGARQTHLALLATTVALLIAAAIPEVAAAMTAMVLLGAGGTAVITAVQTQLQMVSADEMMGRVMALFSMAFVGSKPIGGAIGGGLIDLIGAQFAFGVGAVANAGLLLWLGLRARKARSSY